MYVAHSEVAYARGVDPGIIDRLLNDVNAPGIDDRLPPVLAFVGKLVRTPAQLSQADADAILEANWDENALHDMVAITSRAAFMHRLTAGLGFTPMSREQAAQKARARIEHGYVNLYPSLASRKS